MDPVIGAWTFSCCDLDLHQIATQAEVEDILASWADRDEMGESREVRVYPTRDAAWDAIFPYVERRQQPDGTWAEVLVERPAPA